MSWLYSQDLVAEYLGENCLDGAQFALWSGTSTPQPFSPNDKTMGFWKLSRYGMTYKPLTDDHGKALLMSYLEASRAKTSASQEKAQESTGKEAGCGNTWRELSARYDRNSSSWKTHQTLYETDLPESSVILPRWGMMRAGVLSELTTSVFATAEKECGFWPTPRAGRFGSRPNGKGGKVLQEEVQIAEGVRQRGQRIQPKSLPGLSPVWVEWLMGWPIGWTDLKPLAMGRFRNAQQRHGGF